ncbi:hypothetical protein [Marinobacter confluentis]|uniref:Zinc-regulated TonB-dependent outer membrane receptor n=1 Tax=Marinobacter confluentis TaxID=1697557 RepID=A0A4Z1C2G0_9GAMM|nr:hypothetical protein [Marinobacter confluentis]TGN39252.1 hypothetical protein E5Q11_11415 [Marinobacter confluentis]
MYNLYTRTGFAVLTLLPLSMAQANEMNPDVSVVLDGFYKQNHTALSHREKGIGLGHSELSLSAPIDDLFEGRLTAALESHEGETEVGLEEAFLQTTGMPYNLSVRGGRFFSQVGYLNGRHLHEDDFVERPAAYRALLGSHYFDDGLRLNLLLPTPVYWQIGAEAFNGNGLSEGDEDIGVYTINTRIGSDISTSQSWQAGLSYLRNRQLHDGEHEEEHGGEHEEHEEHGHGGHGAEYLGENLYMADLVWKWAPDGNNRSQQLTLSGEYLYADELGEHASSDDRHEGWYASAVYQFAPQWSVGVRHGQVELKEAHGDHFDDQNLEETDVMLGWSRSHFSTVRLQYTHQEADGFEKADNTVMLQYVMSFGAHGAHGF